MTKTKTTDFINTPLPILCSCRVRLNDEQRRTLKESYNKLLNGLQPEKTPKLPGSSVVTSTSYNVNKQLGLSDFTFRDIINSRETINLGTLLGMSNILGVDVISKEQVMKSMKGYVDYVWESSKDG